MINLYLILQTLHLTHFSFHLYVIIPMVLDTAECPKVMTRLCNFKNLY